MESGDTSPQKQKDSYLLLAGFTGAQTLKLDLPPLGKRGVLPLKLDLLSSASLNPASLQVEARVTGPDGQTRLFAPHKSWNLRKDALHPDRFLGQLDALKQTRIIQHHPGDPLRHPARATV
jgi:hypothetical protein